MKATYLHTDGGSGYKFVAPRVREHETVDHNKGIWKRKGGASTNLAEGYFSQLKRSLDGTHHHVSVEHLQRYLDQFDWLYTYHWDTDSMRMRQLLGQVEGRRLPFSAVIGR